MPMEGKEPWRRVAKDAISTFFASPEFQTLLDDVYDEGYDAAGKDTQGENEEEKAQLKTSAAAICNLIIDFFDGEIQEMKAAKE